MSAMRFIRSTPHLPVRNLKETIDYYRDSLGFTNEWTFGDKDGGIQRDELRILFSEDKAFTENINNSDHRLPLLWFVDNIEEVYAEFKKRNIQLSAELCVHRYGLREFAFVDINGYYVRIAEKVEVRDE